MRRVRRLATLPLIAVMLVGAAPQAFAAADNAVVAINTKDDTFVWRQGFKITRSNGDTVDESNGAAAVSSCERCRTAAVAFQVVLATGTASTVTPTNLAVAINQECLSCGTYAGAFQVAITTHTQVHFTEPGNERIDQIRSDLQTLIAGATFTNDLDEIHAFDLQVEALYDQLVAVVYAEMVAAGGGTLATDVSVDQAA